jgi:hypothetical protein
MGVGLDGVPLFDSFEASGQTLDDAHIVQDVCNGHVTPGVLSTLPIFLCSSFFVSSLFSGLIL